MGIMKTPGVSPAGQGLWYIDAAMKIDGRVQRKRLTKFKGTKSQAIAKRHELMRDLRESVKSRRSLKSLEYSTFGDCLARYGESHPDQKDDYRFQKLCEELGPVPLEDLADRFARYIDLTRNSTTAMGRPPTPSTINKFITYAKAALNYCLMLDLIPKNPLARFPKLREANERSRTVDEKEFLRLFNCLPEFLRPMVAFAHQIPSRRGELAKLEKKDVDLVGRSILFRAENTKTNQARQVPIPSNLFDYFTKIPSECRWAFYKPQAQGTRTLYLPLSQFRSSWKWACKKAGISDFRFHDLRRVAAVNLARKGVHESVIRRLAGWKTDIFFRHYRPVDIEEMKASVADPLGRGQSSVNLSVNLCGGIKGV